MNPEKLSEGLLTEESTSQIEKQKPIGVEMAEKYTNGETKGDENISVKSPLKDINDSNEKEVSKNDSFDKNKDSKHSSSLERKESSVESKDSDFNASEKIKTKRGKSKAQTNGESRISMEKSEESSDEDSSKRQKMSDTHPDSEIGECSGSKNDSSFRKLQSRFKKRYYRSKSSTGEEEAGEASSAQTSDVNLEGNNSKSESDDDYSRDGDDLEERNQTTRKGSTNPPEQESSPRIDGRGADDSNEWTTASEEEMDIAAPVLEKEKPKPKWFVVHELVNRQMGNNPQFACRFYGSLQAVQRLELMRKLNEHQGCVNAISFNQKGNLLASASDDLNVNIWDWATGKRQFSFESGHRSNVFQVKWLPLDTESLMVTCARDGQVRLLELPIGKSRKIGSHQGPIHKLATHRETPHVVLSCGEDGKILSIDIRETRPRKLLVVKEEVQEVQLYSIHSNPLNSNEFCIGGRTQAVRVYDRRKITTPVHKLCPSHMTENKHAHVTSAVYNYNGTEILASYNDEDIYLFDTLFPHPAGDFAHRYQGHRNNATVKGVNFFGPKSEYVVSGSDCGNIFIWDKDTEAIVQWMPGDEQGVVNCLEPHPFVPVLATSGLDYDVKVWVPSCEEPPIMKDLDVCVKSNIKNRQEELDDEPDAFDGQMLWILLRRIRQSERLRASNRAARRTRFTDPDLADDDMNESASDNNSSNNSDSYSDDDNEGRLQCSPS
ncbi:DDB1- and CUL4-associated factor 8-like [Belonocnema kinseyi]|uniref:DDB1- and CUL4-associated factor 8-like n=1 Tax=Belonocnema kinseyi TaxID=2817044 RepID=UPI00143D7E44|nr:DDB1- and CUL4-associated factor 8-like [Belonocnema kinseyi]XP_033225642.1 DDB1- and CUL4-associated factor 8-like [Belonocnema kinseyi]XP_033225643.1 DDB1- and CUL4-associated factor 8-like [Belonocnema kinseyi]